MIAAPSLASVLVCWLPAWLLVQAIGYAVARHDKSLAVANRTRPARRRVPERTFHIVALLGGGAGAWTGFLLHRHKTRKRRFLVPFVVATLLGAALWGAVAALAGWIC